MADVTNGYRPDAAATRGASGVETNSTGASGVGAKAGLAVQLMGAAMSIGLLAGGGVWGYKLIVRDATGVPVVRAMDGPMRAAPSDPGGVVALHTGLSVNTVAAQGEAAPPEDVLVLAPQTSDLTDEDLLVMPTAEADEFHPEAPEPITPVSVEAAEVAPIEIAPSDQPMSAEDILALADSISAGATPLSELQDEPVVLADEVAEVSEDPAAPEVMIDSATIAAEQSAAALAVANAVAEAAGQEIVEPEEVPEVILASIDADGRPLRSLRPFQRPNGLGSGLLSAEEASAEVPAEQTFAVSTEEVPLGTTLVQLGAFDTPDLAGSEWLRLADRFDAFMEGKESLIQEATSGGRSFFRLRATGFVDIADARRFCSALVAEDAACIPVVVR